MPLSCFGGHGNLRLLHSFPTRRSSDLAMRLEIAGPDRLSVAGVGDDDVAEPLLEVLEVARSEEHTSELQSHVNLVCRLLLEKKNHEGSRSIAQRNALKWTGCSGDHFTY